MKIRDKLIIGFLLAILIGNSYGVNRFYNESKSILKKEVQKHLETAASSKSDHVETYLRQNLERLNLVTSRNKLRTFLKDYNKSPSQEKIEVIEDIIIAAEESVEDIKRICVVDLEGNIITSSDKNFIGKKISDKSFFVRAKESNYFSLEEEGSNNEFYFSGPFILEGEVIGVGIVIMDASSLQDIITERMGLGKTGEVVLAVENDAGDIVVVSNNRFLDNGDINNNYFDLLRKSLNGEEKFFDSFKDYRGKEVLAVSRYIELGGIGLIVKIDEEEALGEVVRELKNASFNVFILMFLSTFLIGSLVINLVSKPIQKLQESIKEIEKGNFDSRAEVLSGDEMGELSESFNKMIEAIQKSKSEVEQRVEEQTEEIKGKNKRMSDQRDAILNILEDVEDQKDKFKKERDKIEAIISGIGDGVFMVDENLIIKLFNPVAEMISGFSSEEALGKKYFEVLRFVSENEEGKDNNFIERALETGEVQKMSNHTLLINKAGERVPVADSAAPLTNRRGEIIGCVVVFRDATKEREIDRAKSEFVSLASHQLRTPLSIIRWYVESLLEEDIGKLNKEQEEYLREIYSGNKRMVNLVNSLLNVSRLEMGTFNIEPEQMELVSFAKKIVKEMKIKAQKKKINIVERYDEIGEMSLDRDLVGVILQNLLSNAIKYSKEGSDVIFEVLKERGNIKIVAKDNGIGIPEDQQDQIFQKLFRADNVKTENINGTGLGLYIVKSILDNCEGRIWFESQEGKGTTFYVTIPLSGMKKKKGTKQIS